MGSTIIDSTQQRRELNKIRQVFSRWRASGNHKQAGHPARMMMGAIAGVDSGLPPVLVAEAAGVSTRTIGNWRKQLATEAPQELRLVQPLDEPMQNNLPNALAEPIARIYFQSGIRLELPTSAITDSFLKLLRQTGGES